MLRFSRNRGDVMSKARWGILFVLCAGLAHAQADLGPVNDLPNPYQSAPWGVLPEGRTWGTLSAVAIDHDGESVWVAYRCGTNPHTPPGGQAFAYDSCANSDFAPVMKFDASGKLLRSFGAGLFIMPHKIYQDRAGDIWVLDQRGPNPRELKENPAARDRGHTARKFSPDGKLLLTLGTPGVAGNPPQALTEPTSIVELPNGDLLVSEGHSGQGVNLEPDKVARISRFTQEGKFIKTIGRYGTGPVEFRTPHDLALDAKGRVFVADRGNMRIQVLDTEGNYITEWKQFSRPSTINIAGSTIYVGDSESNRVVPHPGWKQGIRIGEVDSGKVRWFIPADETRRPGPEGTAVDAKGNVYGAEVGQVAKHTRTAP
jgi:sugar lactone lactonase YvrE